MEEARAEAYKFFDRHIGRLPTNSDGTIKLHGSWLDDNDVDAFRHAYVSGFQFGRPTVQKYGSLE